ncbi:MAG TPA: HAMP domain-containing sensor histidine kinase [Candidatus Kapabacteria bacterium]|nr:HAMP domain-containing sensor histidine kinase [Candidatus Kapabacteria bacterium]
MANRIIERGLRIRILTGFSLVILLTLFIAGWSYYHISTLGTAAEHLFIENYRSIGYMHRMELAIANIEESDPGAFASNDAIFRQNLALEFKNITEPGELEASEALDREYAEYIAAPSSALANRVRMDCEAILGMNERAMFARSEAVKAQADFARYSTVAVTLLLVVVAVFLAIAVSRRSLAEFQELDRAKSNFVATAAHELKNPLAAIKTTSAMLKDGIAGPLTEKQKELASTIHTESNRLLDLVRELLDLAKLETGTLELHPTPVDVETLIESAMMPIALRADKAGIAIDAAVAGDVPELEVDPNKMAWAITNLLSNAVRYSRRGGAVEVKASVIEGATAAVSREVWISVTDRGKGIAEKDLGRIFDTFVQIEDSAMGIGSGTGLGLSIAREIVLAHGGRIWATSTVGHGSTFTIALPIHSVV